MAELVRTIAHKHLAATWSKPLRAISMLPNNASAHPHNNPQADRKDCTTAMAFAPDPQTRSRTRKHRMWMRCRYWPVEYTTRWASVSA